MRGAFATLERAIHTNAYRGDSETFQIPVNYLCLQQRFRRVHCYLKEEKSNRQADVT